MLTLLDNRKQHIGLLIVRLREAITSAQRDGAPATESPCDLDLPSARTRDDLMSPCIGTVIVSVKSEKQGPNTPRPASEHIPSPIQSVTPKQDPENDIVELLNHVVCKIKAVQDEVPETSEVRVGQHIAK